MVVSAGEQSGQIASPVITPLLSKNRWTFGAGHGDRVLSAAHRRPGASTREESMQPGRDGTDQWGRSHPHRLAFGRELRTWYERRGLSLRRLADLIPCSFAVIHHAVQGKDWPAPWMVVRADWCLGADRQLVDSFVECWLREELDLAVRAEEDGRPAARHHRDNRLLLDPEEVGIRIVDLSARIVAIVASWTPEMKRRAFLRWSAVGAASLQAVALAGGLEGAKHLVLGADQGAGRADAVAVEQIRDTIATCRHLDDLGMSAEVLRVGRRALARVDELLQGCTSPAARQPLTLIAGELCQLVGHVAAGLHEDETATRYTARAVAAADEAGSAELHAYTMSLNFAYTELYCRNECDLGATADAATAAQEWARLSGNPAVVSHAYSVAARAHARAGHESAALRALDRAERYLERSAPDERPTWLYWYDRAMLLSCRGQCLLDLHREGRPDLSGIDATVAALRGALTARCGGYPRDQAGDHLDLADTYWVHGEREQSARHASDALVLAAGMEWRPIRERLEDVHRRMEGDPLPAVRDFHERFRTLFPN
jgi:Helix-turn-helix domain